MRVRQLILLVTAVSMAPGCVALTESGPRLYTGQHQALFAPPTVGGAAAIPLWTYPDPAARTRVNPWQTWGAPGFGQVNIQSACAYGGCPFWR